LQVVLSHGLGVMRKKLKDLGTRIWFPGKGEFPKSPNRARSQLDVALAGITVADVVMDELSFAL
jgi:hypothetical protein